MKWRTHSHEHQCARRVGLAEWVREWLGDIPVTDVGLKHLNGLPSLLCIRIDGQNFSDAGIEYIGELTNLGYLELGNPRMTDASLKHLKGATRLSVLVIRGAQITDAGLKQLEGLPGLKRLSISGMDPTSLSAAAILCSVPLGAGYYS